MRFGITRSEFQGLHQLDLGLRRLVLKDVKAAERQKRARIVRRDRCRLPIIVFGLGQASIVHCLVTRS